MTKADFTRDEHKVLQEWLRGNDPERRTRADIILKYHRGYTRQEIALSTNYTYRWIAALITLFKLGGIEAIRPKRRGRPSKN